MRDCRPRRFPLCWGMDEYKVSARWYDFVVGRPLASVFRRMAGLAGGASPVLDICSGTGLLAEVFLDSGIKAVGVDISPAMLEVSRARRPFLPAVRADAVALPFQSGVFQAATLTFALHEKAEDTRRRILAEALRVVSPAGRLIIADYRHPRGASRIGAWAVQAVERLAGSEHYAHYRHWMRNGATEGFLERTGVRWRMRRTVLSATAGLYEVFPEA